jgi:hypothetical protein
VGRVVARALLADSTSSIITTTTAVAVVVAVAVVAVAVAALVVVVVVVVVRHSCWVLVTAPWLAAASLMSVASPLSQLRG